MNEHVKILLIKMSSLGDIIHALPTLYAIRTQYPNAHITWAVHEQFATILPGKPWIDEVFIVEKEKLKSFSYLRSLWKELHSRHFDITLDLQSIAKSAIVSAVSGAKKRYAYWELREGSWLVNTALEGPHKYGHVIERYLDTARALGCKVDEINFPLPSFDEAVTSLKNTMDRKGFSIEEPYIVIAPGARWIVKEWPLTSYHQLCKSLLKKGHRIVLIGAASDADKGKTIMDGLTGNICNLIGCTTLPELVELIRRSTLYLSADTGPLHIANALKVPLIALFGTTSPERTGPYGGHHIHILVSPTSKATLQHPLINDPTCMAQITVDEVERMVDEVLEK